MKNPGSISYDRLIWVFIKVGCLAFGGWSTTALLLESELVERRKLLSSTDIHGSVTYSQILPGGTQAAIVSGVGYKLKGTSGSVLATCFYLLPSTLMIAIFSFVYFHYLRDTQLTNHLNIIRAALAGIIFSNAYRIAKHHAGKSILWILVVASFLIKLITGINSVYLILIYAVAGVMITRVYHQEVRHDP